MRLLNKVALITGAASGMGKAAALLFAKEGAKVIVVDQEANEGLHTVEEIRENGGEAIFLRADISNSADVQRIFEGTKKKYEALHILYNNAAIWLYGTDTVVTELKEEIWDRVIRVNLNSVFLCCKYGIPIIIESGGGSVINVSSNSAIKGLTGADAYTASKGAILALTRSMAIEYASKGVRVNCIIPGTIYTPMIQRAEKDTNYDSEKYRRMSPLSRFGKPEEVANMALFLASDEASYAVGGVFIVDGGMSII